MADICVVIPTKNRPILAAAAAVMALEQHGVDVEVIVVDNGSSAFNAGRLKALIDPRVRLETVAEQIGASGARNLGCSLATSPWVAFLDDDDLWASYKLRTQLDALAGTPGATWCISGTVCVDTELKPVLPTRPPVGIADLGVEFLQRHYVSMSDLVVNRGVALECGGFDTSLHLYEDWDFVIRLAQHSPCAAVIDRPLSLYRLNTDSASHHVDEMRQALEPSVARYAAEREAAAVSFDWRAPMFWWAFRMSRAGDGKAASALFREVFHQTHDPRDLVYAGAARLCNGLFVRSMSWAYLRRLPKSWRRDLDCLLDDVVDQGRADWLTVDYTTGDRPVPQATTSR